GPSGLAPDGAGARPAAGTGRAGRGPSAGSSLLRLVQRSARGGPTTPSRLDAHPPAQDHGESRPARVPAPPSPAPHPAPALPYASASSPGASVPHASASLSGASAPSAARPVPVVRPHPPAAAGPGPAALAVQRMAMPVGPESAGPAITSPAPGDDAVPGGAPALSVRVPQPPRPAPGTGGPGPAARAVQRAAAEAGITGVPVRAAPVKPAGPSARTGSAGPPDAAPPAAHRVTGAEIEELARRLLDPVSRLIRADLRRGRERAGRLYDGRR
ncbi:hypothetical protein ABTZ94_30485, partial [Streptomyces sp. NPDC002785]